MSLSLVRSRSSTITPPLSCTSMPDARAISSRGLPHSQIRTRDPHKMSTRHINAPHWHIMLFQRRYPPTMSTYNIHIHESYSYSEHTVAINTSCSNIVSTPHIHIFTTFNSMSSITSRSHKITHRMNITTTRSLHSSQTALLFINKNPREFPATINKAYGRFGFCSCHTKCMSHSPARIKYSNK